MGWFLLPFLYETDIERMSVSLRIKNIYKSPPLTVVVDTGEEEAATAAAAAAAVGS